MPHLDTRDAPLSFGRALLGAGTLPRPLPGKLEPPSAGPGATRVAQMLFDRCQRSHPKGRRPPLRSGGGGRPGKVGRRGRGRWPTWEGRPEGAGEVADLGRSAGGGGRRGPPRLSLPPGGRRGRVGAFAHQRPRQLGRVHARHRRWRRVLLLLRAPARRRHHLAGVLRQEERVAPSQGSQSTARAALTATPPSGAPTTPSPRGARPPLAPPHTRPRGDPLQVDLSCCRSGAAATCR
jgi:hypothetical protein